MKSFQETSGRANEPLFSRLIFEKPRSDIPITSIYVFCDIGSVHEPANMRGVAHFIEHMCFKGTKKIPNAKDVLNAYNKIGASFNAYTDKRLTCYSVKCQDEYVAHSLSILSDMMLHSTFPEREFQKEYKVVAEENIISENDSNTVLLHESEKIVYAGSAYGTPIDCSEYHKAVPLKYKDVVDFYNAHYIPSNMVVSVVSNLSLSAIKRMVAATDFMKKRKSVLSHSNRTLQFGIQPQTEIQYKLIHKKGVSDIILFITFKTCSHSHSDKYPLNLLRRIIGGELSGRLFMLLREDNGLTYSSGADTEYLEHLGSFLIRAETDRTKILKNKKKKGVIPVIVEMIVDLIKDGVNQSELDIAKINMKNRLITHLEDNDTLAEYNGEHMILYGSPPTVLYKDQYDACYKNITREQIHDVIKRYFTPEYMSVCLLGEHLPTEASVKTMFRVLG